jgi:cell division septation protein DedD
MAFSEDFGAGPSPFLKCLSGGLFIIMAFEFGSNNSTTDKSDSLEGGYDEEYLRRARWRLFGAVIFAGFVVAVSAHLLLDDPRPLSHDFTVFISETREPDSTSAVNEKPVTEQASGAPVAVTKQASPSSTSPSTPGFASGKWYVQVGSYSNRGAAEQILKKIRASGQLAVVVVVRTPEGTRYRVRAGPYSEQQAWAYEKTSRSMGYKPLVIKP